MNHVDTVMQFLGAATPATWIDRATDRVSDLLLDHANCEMKAASTALALIYRYPEQGELCQQMSRLAREELRHYEQVQRHIDRLNIERRKLGPARYAAQLNKLIAEAEPHRLRQRLIVGALIEARSCERFAMLAPRLEAPLASFYQGLLESESRHFKVYLQLAEKCEPPSGESRCAEIARFVAAEAKFMTTPESKFRFHSGPPLVERERVKLDAAS